MRISEQTPIRTNEVSAPQRPNREPQRVSTEAAAPVQAQPMEKPPLSTQNITRSTVSMEERKEMSTDVSPKEYKQLQMQQLYQDNNKNYKPGASVSVSA